MKKRKMKKYQIKKAFTKRYKNSAIPYMRRLLNKDDEEKKSCMKI